MRKEGCCTIEKGATLIKFSLAPDEDGPINISCNGGSRVSHSVINSDEGTDIFRFVLDRTKYPYGITCSKLGGGTSTLIYNSSDDIN